MCNGKSNQHSVELWEMEGVQEVVEMHALELEARQAASQLQDALA